MQVGCWQKNVYLCSIEGRLEDAGEIILPLCFNVLGTAVAEFISEGIRNGYPNLRNSRWQTALTSQLLTLNFIVMLTS